MKLLGTLVVLLSVVGVASAVPGVPEIDSQFVGSGVALAAGLLLVARGRRK